MARKTATIEQWKAFWQWLREQLGGDVWHDYDDVEETETVATWTGGIVEWPRDRDVEPKQGIVTASEVDSGYVPLNTMWSRWLKTQTHETVAVCVPKQHMDALRVWVKEHQGKVA